MVVVALIVYGLGCYALGYLTCQGKLRAKVEEFVNDHTKYEDDTNPPGSL